MFLVFFLCINIFVKMAEFLAENNLCGQTILLLVSRGNAIIAEILRLKDYIPAVFKLELKPEREKYADIILDFSYFKITEAHENKIENNEALHDLDKEFKDNNIQMITRFYAAFESILSYILDLNRFIDDLTEGVFIHQSMESVLADIEGKQLLCESLFLYGTMLILVDYHIEGIIRERLLVSYYRYTPQRRDTQSSIDNVCKLLRDTGLNSKKSTNYPEDYFKRISIKHSFIDIIISRLRSDDIYNQLSIYPSSKHRSTALSVQSSMLYVCLYFSPETLHNKSSVMREIVDKYFPDNFNVSIYMGHTVSLIESWDGFKAAKMALNNTLDAGNIKECVKENLGELEKKLEVTDQILKEGFITGDSLLASINKILNIFRECNVTIRWLMLHSIKKSEKIKRSKQIQDLITAECKYEPSKLFKLILNTAQLELNAMEEYRLVLDEKESKWAQLKNDSCSSLNELSEVFGGAKPLSRVEKNSNLEKWFLEISTQIASLEQSNEKCSRKLVQLIQALEEVEEFHQLRNNVQVIQYLSETRGFLHKMIRTMRIREDVLINMQIIGDLSYAWHLIDFFTHLMQDDIKRDPKLVTALRAVFLKLASVLEIPLLRINQAKSPDLVSVSQYYSTELESYIRRVLQIIPVTMFDILKQIIDIRTNILVPLPTRLEKDKLKEYAQLDTRFELAKLTHNVALFSEGMRTMKTTLVGIVRLDPNKMLEDGIRKELVQNVAKALHNEIKFSAKLKPEEFDRVLENAAKIMDGYKRSFEYIGDYINIHGLKIWQEEVTRIINYNVEQECNGFLKVKINDWDSLYQNRFVPIPIYPQFDASLNFIGRLARELIRITDPRYNMYVDYMTSWCDTKSKKTILDIRSIGLISSAIEITGVVGLDRVYSFMIIVYLQKIQDILCNKDKKNPTWLNTLQTIRNELENIEDVTDHMKFYQNCIQRSSKIFNILFDFCCIVGQLQILRSMLSFHLNTSCAFNAKSWEASLRALNTSLLINIKKGDTENLPSEELLLELEKYFSYAGLNNPFFKIYISVKSDRLHAVNLFIFAMASLSKLSFFTEDSKKSLGSNCATCFTLGLHTILRQYHSELNDIFIKNMAQYMKDITMQNINLKGEPPLETFIAIQFMKQITRYSETTATILQKYFPDEFVHLLTVPDIK